MSKLHRTESAVAREQTRHTLLCRAECAEKVEALFTLYRASVAHGLLTEGTFVFLTGILCEANRASLVAAAYHCLVGNLWQLSE